MAQLFSTFGVNWSLLIAQVINFAIVLIALWYFLYKPVLTMLEKRKKIIAEGVADAEKSHDIFLHADEKAKESIKVADTEASAIIAQARTLGGKEKERLLEEAQARADKVAVDAQLRATELLERTRKDSEQEIARLAILAAEKTLRTRYD